MDPPNGEKRGDRMKDLRLRLEGLEPKDARLPDMPGFSLADVRNKLWDWDRVVKGSHPVNCWYQRHCNFNIFVKDGVVLREEQAGNYPHPNDPKVPDCNPRGCQKGVCFSHRMYDPTRLKYPLKRIGGRGMGKWQRISWDQGLTEIADILIDILTTEGPQAIIDPAGTGVGGHESSTGSIVFFHSIGAVPGNTTGDDGDDHEGVAEAIGKVNVCDSADNWFYADIILVWGANPAYTQIAQYHYIAEARYNGTRVITIAPDYSSSAMHSDLWIPVNIGTDAALALGMAQVVIQDRLYKEDFVREQTDLPILVIEKTGKLLREADLKKGGRDDVYYFYDQGNNRIVEAPRKSLALDGAVPALEGQYEVKTLAGRVRVKPVMQLFKEKLDREYTPEQASEITGVPPDMIRRLALETAQARGVVNISTSNWGKFYHGNLIERSIFLLFALCGHMGRKGAGYNAFPHIGLDTAMGVFERTGDQILVTAAGADPRFVPWRRDGYTDEMILSEYAREVYASGTIQGSSLFYFIHGGLLEESERHNSWDPYLERPLKEYVDEAFEKGWQHVFPGRDDVPKVFLNYRGSFLRRARNTNRLIEELLPKLKLLVCMDIRMGATGLYSDYVLPTCGWYERTTLNWSGTPISPFIQVNDKAVEPLYETKTEWEIWVLLARKIAERARERGMLTYRDANGRERRLDQLEERLTFDGLYHEEDEEGMGRDMFVNASNAERIDWEELKARGFARYTGTGKAFRSIGNACDVVPDEPIIPLTHHTEKKQPYPTQTRRIHFYIDHDLFLELGEALPAHKDSPKAGGDYPLQLTGGHARWSINSVWVDDSLMLRLQRGEPLMFMSRNDAAARGIEDGDSVKAYNDVGSLRIQVAVTPAVRPGQVIVHHGWENHQFEDWRHFKSVMASPLNPIELAGGYYHIRPTIQNFYPGFSDRDSRVEVEKVEKPGSLA
jgi:DMSO reductase family type II enzyme molybdopterin subunit